GRDLWPLIRREVESVYYGTLLTASGRDSDRRALVDKYLSAGEGELDALLDAAGIDPHERWDWERIAKPCAGQEFADRDA
ncbi:FAD-binding protein, partial [Streptomyces sp. SID8455]|nr:FAD-binding protein [Streptomyces sp. SID8455]